MNDLQTELLHGFPDFPHFVRVVVRMAVAIFLGGAIGFERQLGGKAAGIRTHMLVALGAALFTLIPLEAGMKVADLSRVIQGVATGVGFLGAGMIFKPSESKEPAPGHKKREVHGLTTAAGIWLTAAVGLAAGAGWIWPALIGVFMTLLIMSVMHGLEHLLRRHGKHATADRLSEGGQP